MARRKSVLVSESDAQQAGAEIQALIDLNRQTSAVTDDGTQENYSPGGADSFRRSSVIFLDPGTSDLVIGGLVAPSGTDAVKRKTFVNLSQFKNVEFVNESVGSTAANRIAHSNSQNVIAYGIDLTASASQVTGGIVVLDYDDITQRWQIVSAVHDQLNLPSPSQAAYRRSDGSLLGDSGVAATQNWVLARSANTTVSISPEGYLLGVEAIPALWLPGTSGSIQTLVTAASLVYNVRNGVDAEITLNQAHTALTWGDGGNAIFNATRGRLLVKQDATGGRTIASYAHSGGGSVIFAGGDPALSTAPNAVDIFDWWSDGTDIYVVPTIGSNGVGSTLAWGATISGAGTHPLTSNRAYLYDDSAGDAFTMQFPANPVDGDEVQLFEVGDSDNPVTLDGNGNTVGGPFTMESPAASKTLAHNNLSLRYKFNANVSGGTWIPIDIRRDTDWVPNGQTTSGVTLEPFQEQKYSGALTFTINLPASPSSGDEVMIVETQDSGEGVVTVSGNGNNLVASDGQVVASEDFSLPLLVRRWKWDAEFVRWSLIQAVRPRRSFRASTAVVGPTTVGSYSAGTNNRIINVRAIASARQTTGAGAGNTAKYVLEAQFLRDGVGTLTKKYQDTVSTFEDDAAWDFNLEVSGTDIEAQVTGIVTETIRWLVEWEVTEHG